MLVHQAYRPTTIDYIRSGIADDLVKGLERWRLWTRLGIFDVRRRYMRTTIGPFWTTLSVGVFASVLSIVYAQIWNMPVSTFFPYFVAGYITWTLLVTFVLESCVMFVGSEAILRNIPIPLTFIACSVITRNVIVFAHHLVVYFGVALFFRVPFYETVLLIIPALLLLSINAWGIGIILGTLCTRYRDVTQVITVVTNLLFFLTPVIWMPAQVTGWARFYLVELNPFYHFIEVVRHCPDPRWSGVAQLSS